MTRDFPTHFDTPRLHIRAYAPGDGAMIFAVAQKNRAHLQRYESGNLIFSTFTESGADILISLIGHDWQKGIHFFLGAFARGSGEFVAQIYVGVVNQDLPEFEVGYFVDVDHEGRGYVSEAVRATLHWLFEYHAAQRVSLRCDDTNLRSARVAERCGFTLEGHLRETHRGPANECTGDLLFGLLRKEWVVPSAAAIK